MRELQQKHRLKRRLYSIPVLILLAFITVLIARGTYQVFEKRGKSESHVSILEQKVRDLENKEKRLSADIAALGTEAGIEKEVKEKFNVSKEGEHVVILVDEPKGTSTEEVSNEPWYVRLWNAIIPQ